MGLNAEGFGFHLYADGGNQVAGEFNKATHSARQTERSFGGLMGGAARLGGGIMGLGVSVAGLAGVGGLLALGSAAASTVGTFATFESSMSRLGALGGVWQQPADEAARSMERLEAKARSLGATTIYSASQAAEAMTILAQAGYSVSDMLDTALTDSVLMLAQAGGTDLQVAADTMAVALKSMKLQTTEAARATDVMAAAAVAGRVDVKDMVTVFGYAGGAAQLFGVSLEELGGAMAVASNAGIDASTVGTSMRAIFSRLAAPSRDAADALDLIGVKTSDFLDEAGHFKDVNEIFGMLAGGISKLGDDAQKVDVMKSIGGAEAMTTFQALVEGSGLASNAFADISRQMELAGLNSGALANTMNGPLKSSMDLLSSQTEFTADAVTGLFTSLKVPTDEVRAALDGVGIALQGVDGAARPLSEVVGDLAGKWTTLTGEQQQAIGAMVDGTTHAEDFAVMMDQVAASGGALTPELQKMVAELDKTALASGGAAKAMSDMMNDNLVGDWKNFESAIEEAQIEMVKGSGTGGLLRSVVKGMTQAVTDATTWLKNFNKSLSDGNSFASRFIDGVKMIANGVWELISLVGDNLTDAWRMVEEAVTNMWNNTMSIADGLIAGLGGVDAAWQTLKDTVDIFFEVIESAWDVIVTAFEMVYQIIMEVVEGILHFAGPIIEFAQSIGDRISHVFNMISEAFRDIGNAAAEEGTFFEQVLNGIGEAIGFLGTLIMAIIDMVVMVIEGLIFGIVNMGMIFTAVLSTIVDFFVFLGSVVAGFFVQLASWTVYAAGAILQFVEGAYGLFIYLWDNILAGLAAVGNFFIDVWNAIAENVVVPFINFFIEAFNFVGAIFYDIWNAIAGFFAGIWDWMIQSIVVPAVESMLSIFDAIGGFFFDLWNGISAAFFDIIGGIVGGFESMVNFFIDGINEIIGAISAVSEVLGLGEIGTLSQVDFGAGDFAADANAARSAQYEGLAGSEGSIAKMLGDSLSTGFEPAVFMAAETLDGAALSIADRFDDTGKSWSEAQAEAAGALGSADVMGAAEAMQQTADDLMGTPIMSDDTATQWQGVADEWNKSFDSAEDSADATGEAAAITEESKEKDMRGAEATADHMRNVEKQNEAAARQAGKGVRVANADEIRPKPGDLQTTVNFNQTIDTEKKREQFVLDNTLRSYALVV